MVGIVLVSHSKALAKATEALMKSTTQGEVPVAIAAGTGEDQNELGTDAMAIFEAIESVYGPDGVLILMDMGSAILSTEMALDFLEEEKKGKIQIAPAPFIEGAVAAGVSAMVGDDLNVVYKESVGALKQKIEHVRDEEETSNQSESASFKDGRVMEVTISNRHGLHARPVARLIQKASTYQSEIQIRNISKNKGPVSIRSMTGIIALEALQGDRVELAAVGEDAEKALQELTGAIQKGLGDRLDPNLTPQTPVKEPEKEETKDIRPVGLGSGLVIGKPVFYREEVIEIPKEEIADQKVEIDRFERALEKSIEELKNQESDTEIFKAQAVILADPVLKEKTQDKICDQKQSATAAWWDTAQEVIQQYRDLADKNLRERAQDVRDVALRVLQHLGVSVQEHRVSMEKGILILDTITPKEVMALDKEKVKAVVCYQNGPTSHSSILLISREIPAVVQAIQYKEQLASLNPESEIIVDTDSGGIQVEPDKKTLTQIKEDIQVQKKQRQRELKNSGQSAITKDREKISVFANVARKEDSELAAKNGAEGIGLLRTEFMFLDREKAPSEEEQVEILRGMLEPLKGKPVVIRTLDAGGDKNIPYLNLPNEQNPFLGVRAIRLSLRNPDLFKTQLRALLQVSADNKVEIMFPMIALPHELKAARKALRRAHFELEKEECPHSWPVKVGMMMEIPSAALLAEEFASQVDFFSIGTNDLVQYTMAADRGNSELQESLGKGLNQAVLRLIKTIIQGAKTQDIPVTVCGETASHPELAGLLLGLGVRELSMNPGRIPKIKEWIRSQELKKLEEEALKRL